MASVPVQVPSITPLMGLGSKSGSLGAADAPLLSTVRLTLGRLADRLSKEPAQSFPRLLLSITGSPPGFTVQRDPPIMGCSPWESGFPSAHAHSWLPPCCLLTTGAGTARFLSVHLSNRLKVKFLFLSPNPSPTLLIPSLGCSPSAHFSPSPPAALGQR